MLLFLTYCFMCFTPFVENVVFRYYLGFFCIAVICGYVLVNLFLIMRSDLVTLH